MTGTYSEVMTAADTIREAIHTYAETRYQNYRMRLVSPRGAYEHAMEDLTDLVRRVVDQERTRISYDHAEEINR